MCLYINVVIVFKVCYTVFFLILLIEERKTGRERQRERKSQFVVPLIH